MKVRVIREFLNGSQKVAEGTELVVSERRGRELEDNKLVVPIEIGKGERARRAARQAGATGPTPIETTTVEMTEELQAGGPTGAERPRSSSRRGRPRKTPLSSLVGAEHVS